MDLGFSSLLEKKAWHSIPSRWHLNTTESEGLQAKTLNRIVANFHLLA